MRFSTNWPPPWVIFWSRRVKAGAQVVQPFESWAGALGPEEYRTFALPYMAKGGITRARHGCATHRLLPGWWMGAA
jgi:uroporphyrinogen decarboxylase